MILHFATPNNYFTSQLPTKNFFRVQSTRLTDPFEPLNSSLAQSTEELGRW